MDTVHNMKWHRDLEAQLIEQGVNISSKDTSDINTITWRVILTGFPGVILRLELKNGFNTQTTQYSIHYEHTEQIKNQTHGVNVSNIKADLRSAALQVLDERATRTGKMTTEGRNYSDKSVDLPQLSILPNESGNTAWKLKVYNEVANAMIRIRNIETQDGKPIRPEIKQQLLQDLRDVLNKAT